MPNHVTNNLTFHGDQQFKKHIQKYAIGDVDKNLLPMLG